MTGGIPLQPAVPDAQTIQNATVHRSGLMQGCPQPQKGVHRLFWVLPQQLHWTEAPVLGEGEAVQQNLAGAALFQTGEGLTHPYSRALWQAMPENGLIVDREVSVL